MAMPIRDERAGTSAPSGRIHDPNRFEIKYLLPTRELARFLGELAPFVSPDPQGGPEGYRVHSIYWDTPDLRCFREKLEGLKFRRKLRLRRYGESDQVFIEIKQREDRTNQKRRVKWPAQRVWDVLGDGIRPVDLEAAAADPVAKEAALMVARWNFAPRIAVGYRRRALVGRFDEELRVTFDGPIQYHASALDIRQPFVPGRYVIDPRVTVLEIKYSHRVPTWLLKLIATHGLGVVRMSKYTSAVDRCWFGGQHT